MTGGGGASTHVFLLGSLSVGVSVSMKGFCYANKGALGMPVSSRGGRSSGCSPTSPAGALMKLRCCLAARCGAERSRLPGAPSPASAASGPLVFADVI